jgi:hypothetical protein
MENVPIVDLSTLIPNFSYYYNKIYNLNVESHPESSTNPRTLNLELILAYGKSIMFSVNQINFV